MNGIGAQAKPRSQNHGNNMCYTPINLKKEKVVQKLKDTYHMQQVPCGKCLECLKLRVNSWYVRLMEQKKHAESAYFVTLTYSEENLPFSENGLMSLDYRDTQLFWKKIRFARAKTAPKIKYFLVGEYGSKTHRPHYHAITFNVSPEEIEKHWTHGQVHVVPMNEKTTYYTLKYALKRANKWKKNEHDDRFVEKALMSRGLGLDFLTENMVKFYHTDVSRPVIMLGNKKLPLPRYYRDKLFTDAQKMARNKLLLPHNDKRYEKTSSKLFPQRVQKMYEDNEKKQSKTD